MTLMIRLGKGLGQIVCRLLLGVDGPDLDFASLGLIVVMQAPGLNVGPEVMEPDI